MKRFLTRAGKMVLALLVPQLLLAQWTEGQEGQLVIRGGWLFDSVSDERRPNTGIVIKDGKIVKDGVAYDPAELLHSAEGKIGPAGPNDHADWELKIRPLREN